jgi:hypothetical protein
VTADSTTSAVPTPEPPPLRSVHTTNFGPRPGELGLSLLVTTSQAGKLVVLRQNNQGTLNTYLRTVARPMGLAVVGDRPAWRRRWRCGSPTTCRRQPGTGSWRAATTPASCPGRLTSPAMS